MLTVLGVSLIVLAIFEIVAMPFVVGRRRGPLTPGVAATNALIWFYIMGVVFLLMNK